MRQSLYSLGQQLEALTVFAPLKQDRVVQAMQALLRQPEKSSYIDFVSALYEQESASWSSYLANLVLNLETCVTRLKARNAPIDASMQSALEQELDILESLLEISCDDFSFSGYTPRFDSSAFPLKKEYLYRLEHISQYGFGMYARYHMFRLNLDPLNPAKYCIEPVEYPDPIRLDELIGYEFQKRQVIENTQILLAGYLASNVLLYGDAGTGKSATVKAIANEYRNQGLRLIEIGKEQLHVLPSLLDELSVNPMKFILFIDDLSFQENDDNFSALKAVLEGSVSVRSKNTVIYATSNRRHIVRETFQARAGDEVHRTDTMQETVSLSERFGIKVNFEKPKKDVYSQIVLELASQYGLDMEEKALLLKAEQFALRKAGRSARAARQLVEQLYSAQKTEREKEC